ncbi:hypothetical protein B0H19DRAFT_1084037 [Mycena capillaripes]|nr:hypothetical protein B0H19DRAFT_1084037 [Mycena capillaripes]
MGGSKWTTTEQQDFLQARLPAYLAAKAEQKEPSMARFWNSLDAAWFETFPEEPKLGLPPRVPGAVPLTEEERKRVGEATISTKKQLKTWMRWREPVEAGSGRDRVGRGRGGGRSGGRSLFQLLQRQKTKRPLRPVEVYQKNYSSKIMEEVLKLGYGEMNEEAEAERVAAAKAEAGPSEAKVLTAEELQAEEKWLDDLAVARVLKNRQLRMSLCCWTQSPKRSRTTSGLRLNKLNQKRAEDAATSQDDERTPEQYQHAIDQIPAVLANVRKTVMQETGWHLFSMLVGPMPERGGQISTKTFCYGETPAGNDFQAACTNFEVFKIEFNKWGKRCFPHDVRDARGLRGAGSQVEPPRLDGLISLEPASSEVDNTAPTATHAAPGFIADSTDTDESYVPPYFDAVMKTLSDGSGDYDDYEAYNNYDNGFGNLDYSNASGSRGSMAFDGSSLGAGSSSDSGSTEFELGSSRAWSDGDLLWDKEEEDGGLGHFAHTHAVQPPCPSPRPIFQGASFDKDRVVGSSPGRAPKAATMQVDGFNFSPLPQPSALFQAFARGTSRVSSWPSSSGMFGSEKPVPVASLGGTATLITSVDNALPSTALTPTPTPRPSLPPASRPSWLDKAASGPPPPSRPRAVETFASALTNATAAVQPQQVPPVQATPALASTPTPGATPAVPTPPAPVQVTPAPAATPTPSTTPSTTSTAPPPLIPQFPASRPMCNPPKGHPLNPATKKKADAAAAKAAQPDKPPPRPRGRPRKVGEPTVSAPGGGEMSAAARAESTRIWREEAQQRKVGAEMRARAKAVEADAAAREAAEKRERERLHNPAGDHDLFITGARPKRAAKAYTNHDGTPIICPKKRTQAELQKEADAKLLPNLAASREGNEVPEESKNSQVDGIYFMAAQPARFLGSLRSSLCSLRSHIVTQPPRRTCKSFFTRILRSKDAFITYFKQYNEWVDRNIYHKARSWSVVGEGERALRHAPEGGRAGGREWGSRAEGEGGRGSKNTAGAYGDDKLIADGRWIRGVAGAGGRGKRGRAEAGTAGCSGGPGDTKNDRLWGSLWLGG